MEIAKIVDGILTTSLKKASKIAGLEKHLEQAMEELGFKHRNGLEKHLEQAMEELGFKHRNVDWEMYYDESKKPVMTVKGYNKEKYEQLSNDLQPDFNTKFVKDHLVFLSLKRFGKIASIEDDFQEKMDEILESARQALKIVKEHGDSSIYNRAKSYWFGHIQGAVDTEETGILGGSMYNMASTLKEIRGSLNPELIGAYKKRLKSHGIEIAKSTKNEIFLKLSPDAKITQDDALSIAYDIASELEISQDVGIDFK